jgi:bile acid:Na+ symporter, BASS family
MLENLDQVKLNFNQDSLLILNICIGFIMFGVALELKIEDFKRIATHPKPVVVGIFSQFALLPALTFLYAWLVSPSASVALGMILVASCPGGNISNFITLIAKGSAALSVTLTAFSTVLAMFMTPLNFSFWGDLYTSNSQFDNVSVDYLSMLQTIMLLLGIPLVLGMWVAYKFPGFTQKIKKGVRIVSLLMFAGFVAAALAANFDYFMQYIHLIVFLVFGHNALAFLGGYAASKLSNLSLSDTKSITIETGIQNSGLALVIVFQFFDGQGGMAYIAAWWGVWHILSGLALAWFLARIHDTKKINA